MLSTERLIYKRDIVGFLKDPKVTLIDGGKQLILEENYLFTAYDKTVTIYAGFQSDGSSVHWAFSRIVPRLYGTATAAIIHDAIYRHIHHYGFTREQADDIYRIVLIRHGFSLGRAKIAWSALRVGGFPAWRKVYAPDTER